MGVSESPLNYTQSVSEESLKNELELGIRPELFIIGKEDIVMFGLSVFFRHAGESILSYGVRLTYKVGGWDEMISKMSDEEIRKQTVMADILVQAIGFVRGSMYVRTQNTPVSKLCLPTLSTKELQNNIIIRKP